MHGYGPYHEARFPDCYTTRHATADRPRKSASHLFAANAVSRPAANASFPTGQAERWTVAMMESSPIDRPGSSLGDRPARRRRVDPTVSRTLVGALAGIVGVVVALVWVMNLEATLPSIRAGDQSFDGPGSSKTLRPGTYLAENPAVVLSGKWFKQTLGTSSSLSTTSSMVTSTSGSSMTFRFYGTDLGLTARIGPESGTMYVTIDGQGSSILPVDSRGSFVDLYANQAKNQTIQIATGLAHRDHTVQIVSGGGGQVAINSFHISAHTPFPWAFVFLYAALTAGLFVLVRTFVISTCTLRGWL